MQNKRVTHRDIKPENILYNKKKQIIKIIDLGFAKIIDDIIKITNSYVGSPLFMAPQIFSYNY